MRPAQKLTFVTFVALLLIFVVTILVLLSPYLLALLTGVILALTSRPIYQLLLTRRIRAPLAAAIVTVGIALLVVGPLTTLVTRAIQQGITLVHHITQEPEFSPDSLIQKFIAWPPVQTILGDAEAVENQLKGAAQKGIRAGSAVALGILGNLPEIGLQLVIALLSCFFVLVDGGRFLNWINDKIPLETSIRENVYASFRDTAISVIWATVAAAIVQAIIMFFAFIVLGVPAAFLAAGATFIFAWIPVVGSAPVWIAGAIYCYAKGSLAKALIMVGFGIATSLSDNFVRPIVLRGRSDMHPFISLISIFGGVHFFGLLGVFFGPILMAVSIALLDIWPQVKRRYESIDASPVSDAFID